MKILFPRADCKSPQQYYTCASNGFKGCCSVDPCSLPGCPNSGSDDEGSTGSGDEKPKPNPKSDKSQISTTEKDSPTPKPATTVQSSSTPQTPSTTQSPSTSQITASAASSRAQQPSSTQSQAVAQQPASPSTSAVASSQPPVTVVLVTQITQTPSSNGVALAPTTVLVTSTAVSTPAAVSETSPSTPATISTQPGASSSKTPIIVGVVAGIGGVLIAAALLWFCWRRKSKKNRELREEKAAHSHEDDPREQGIDANRAGDVIAGYGKFSMPTPVCSYFAAHVVHFPNVLHDVNTNYKVADFYRGADRRSIVNVRESLAPSESTAVATDYGHKYDKTLPTTPVTPNRHAFTEDPVPYLDSTHVRPNVEMIGSSPDPAGYTPELSGIAAPVQPAELSPNPERLRINNQSPTYSGISNAGPQTSSDSVMRSNLNLSTRGQNRRAPNAPHVMSWMEYSPDGMPRTGGTDSSAPSGVWSSAESSNYIRDSGVSQDSLGTEWRREKRVRSSGGGLEAIRDEGRL
ncbi:hypothetical protein MMC16_001240 [Acarospora aff. strigata]|nr:hypothetical protein [Acarospora aff. strigata]